MAPRRGRGFWTRIVREAERGGVMHAEVASRHGVNVATLRAWIYRLRRDRRTERRDVRMLPVEVVAATPSAGAGTIDVRIASGVIVTFAEGADVTYVAALLAAMRRAPC